MIGFGLPLVILVVVLAIAYAVTHSEPLSALVSIAALVPYYIIIYMCRDRLKRDFSFAIDS